MRRKIYFILVITPVVFISLNCRVSRKQEVESKIFNYFVEELVTNKKIFEYGNKILLDTSSNSGIKKLVYGDYNFYSSNKTCLITPINFYLNDSSSIENYFKNYHLYQSFVKDYLEKKERSVGGKKLKINNNIEITNWKKFLKEADSNSLFFVVYKPLNYKNYYFIEIDYVFKDEIETLTVHSFFILFDKNYDIIKLNYAKSAYFEEIPFCIE